MAFARQNFLEALGKGHYHSCLMSCYTFDFQFFELRVMRMLRAAGIQNILVLTDGPFLEYLASTPSGREFQESSGFTIYPIYRPTGVFHPKVSLFFGAKEGLLAIGSGNLTASGMGNNDEAWGCFHVADTNAPNAALFADAWAYTQQLTAQALGMPAVKMAWIRQFSPWLANLPTPNPGTLHRLDNGLSAAFLTNAGQGILQQALALVEASVVTRIVSVSPYYDQQGLVLNHLYTTFPAAELQCVVEERFGLLPEKLPPDIAGHITFHSWQKCGAQQDGHASRLHAKLLHFITSEGEYLLLGSANVTAAGMGAGPVHPINEEASILLHHRQGHYLSGLGIKPAKENADALEALQKAKKRQGITEEGVSTHFAALPISVVLAEIEQHVLTLHLTALPAEERLLTVRLFTVRGLVHTSPPVVLTNPLRVALPELPASVNRVELYDGEQTLIGLQFVQHPGSQQPYCPDPNRQRLQMGLDELTNSGFDGFAEFLLDLVDLESDADLTYRNGSLALLKEDKTGKASQKLTAEEFNQAKQDELLRQQAHMNSAGVHISSFLNEVGKRLLTIVTDEDYRESTEQGIDTATDEGDQDSSIDAAVASQNEIAWRNIRVHKSILKFLKRLQLAQAQCLTTVTNAEKPQSIKLSPLTIRDFSVFNISLHVALHYIGRFYYQGEQERQQKIYFMTQWGDLHDYQTLKGFCSITIGNFLLQCTAGVEEYDDPLPLLQARLAAVRRNCFEKCLFLVLNAPWRSSESEMRDLLLVNILHYLRPATWSLNDLPSLLAESFEALSERAMFDSGTGATLLYQLLPTFTSRLQQLQATLLLPAAERAFCRAHAIQVGQWLFNSKLGICSLGLKYEGSDNIRLTLLRPGFQETNDHYTACYRYQLLPESKLLTV